MSNQRRPGCVRQTSPDEQPKAKARAKTSRKNEAQKKDKDGHECESEDKLQETPLLKRGRSKKQKDDSNGDIKSLDNSESKSEKKHGEISKTASVNKETGENDRQDSAKNKLKSKRKTTLDCESEGKTEQTANGKSGEKTAPKRPSKKEKGHPNHDREATPENSESKLEQKSTASSTRNKSTPKTGFPGAKNARDASPAVSARSPDRKPKSTEKTAVKDPLEDILKATVDKLTIKKSERSEASRCVNAITEKVIAHLKQDTTWCADVERLRTGSYYENLKICEPDEFDVMLTVPVERVDIQMFDEAGAFYSIALKRHPNKHPLDKFLNEDKTIQASDMLNEFRDAVKKAVEKATDLPYEIKILRKKPKCPAVTLEVTEGRKKISVDFVLGLKVHRASWPDFTKDGFKVENWLGKKEKANMKRQPFYLVPKYEGMGNAEHDGVVAKDSWRISFSHIEKEILNEHGHTKICCEGRGQKCCRKVCLKLLKYLLQQLKNDSSKSTKMSSFCSYHAKTTLLHACALRATDSEWAYDQLVNCFKQLLEDFVKHLRNHQLPNFFIPSHNLLNHVSISNCDFLAKEIEFQLNNTFPIFSYRAPILQNPGV
ncbi:cyclic GMP-AMP synthase [Danio aesculapii]|uniref:cyclic GMP-AMP synthase n=1 Tax=Danio aesculapii TaxID=1142201 RepID=UPI0024BF2BD9|nr:cyclic GMP-AMP synthase [Danio aesculapii]